MNRGCTEESLIGKSLPRPEGEAKLTGRALYADDLKFDGCLFGATVRSNVPRGRVKDIRFLDGIPGAEFVIVLPRDIPGENAIQLIDKSQPFLAEEVRHIAEPVAVIAHPDRNFVQKALGFIEVEIDEAPAVFEIEEALSGGNIQYGADNVMKEYRLARGNVEAAWPECDLVIEETFRTGAQEHLYIEPQGVIARYAPANDVTIWGSLQCPFYVRKALAPLFSLPPEKVRVIQAETGGGFGGKEEYPNILAGHAALLSWKSGGKFVKMIYDRREDLRATTKRHPSRTIVKAGFKKDGRLRALDIDFVLNGGAYPTLSQVVLSRGLLHSFGPYLTENVRARARAVFTNSNPFGAFRGFGAPQAVFAIECLMTQAAVKLGIDPVEIRRRNFLRKGDRMPTGQEMKEELDLPRLMDTALRKADYERKRRDHEEFNRKGGATRRGIGVSTFFHGSGFTGSGEVMLASRAAVRFTKEGGIEVLASSIEMGQGTTTVLTQIAAETLRVPPEWVVVVQPDTGVVPDSGPTVASRTTMVVGKLVARAAESARKRIVEFGGLGPDYRPHELREAARRYFRANGEARDEAEYESPAGVLWDEASYQGEAYAAFGWSCDVAEVEVDLTTGEIIVRDFVSTVECGRVINPVIAAGQIEGGIGQTIGYATCEEVVMERGEMKNASHTNYIIPTTKDAPPIRVEFVSFPFHNPGPFSAKGIGELPADGTAPALLNAVQDALKIPLREIPMTPERVLEALTTGGESR